MDPNISHSYSKCEHCGGIAHESFHVGPGVQYGYRIDWSDGHAHLPMFNKDRLPYFPAFLEKGYTGLKLNEDLCQWCGKITRHEYVEEKSLPADTKCMDRLKATIDDIKQFIETTKIKPDLEVHLQKQIWRQYNDKIRDNPFAFVSDEYEKENLRKLYNLISDKDEEDRLVKSEIARELGLFSKSLTLLQKEFKDYNNKAEAIWIEILCKYERRDIRRKGYHYDDDEYRESLARFTHVNEELENLIKSRDREIQEKEKELGVGGAGCLIALVVAIIFGFNGSWVFVGAAIVVGFIFVGIAESIEGDKDKKLKPITTKYRLTYISKPTGGRAKEDIKLHPPSLIKIDGEDTSEITPQEINVSEQENDTKPDKEETHPSHKREKNYDHSKSFKKRKKLTRQLNEYYQEVDAIEKECGFEDDIGARASVYEGLIDWEDAAGFEHEDKKDKWFRIMDEIEKRESSVEKLDDQLMKTPLVQACQDCERIYVSNSILSSLSIDAIKSVIENGIDEMEEDGSLTKTQQFRSAQTGITHSINIYFSNERDVYDLVVTEDTGTDLGAQEVGVSQFYDIRTKINYALSQIHQSGSSSMNN